MTEKKAAKKVEQQARGRKVSAKPAPNAAKVETRQSKTARIHP